VPPPRSSTSGGVSSASPMTSSVSSSGRARHRRPQRGRRPRGRRPGRWTELVTPCPGVPDHLSAVACPAVATSPTGRRRGAPAAAWPAACRRAPPAPRASSRATTCSTRTAVAGAAELGERERRLVRLRPVPRAELPGSLGHLARRRHRVERPVQRSPLPQRATAPTGTVGPHARCSSAPTWWRSSIGLCAGSRVGSPTRCATTARMRASTCSRRGRPRRRDLALAAVRSWSPDPVRGRPVSAVTQDLGRPWR
jgi:hypothetical protein